MRRMLTALVVAVSVLAIPTRADDIEDLVNALRPSPLDYAAWSGNLIKAAGNLKGRPEAQARLHEKAYEFGIKNAKGYPTAIEAARAMLRAKPDQRTVWQQRLLNAYRLDWQAADRKRKEQAGKTYIDQMIAVADEMAASGKAPDAIRLYTSASYLARRNAPDRTGEVAEKLKDLREQQQLQRQLAQFKRALAQTPQNTAVRERFIRLYVVELDDPAEAKKLLRADVPEALRTYVPLAAKAVADLAKDACLELGEWYESLTAGATLRGKAKALARAKAYYERSISLEKDAVKRALAKTKLAKVEKQLRELPVSGQPAEKQLTLALGGGVTMKLALVPAETFIIGSPKSVAERFDNERPQHMVTIRRPFYMGVTEVTQEQYQAVMGKNPSKFKGAKSPVDSISWRGAAAFCQKLSELTRRLVRLPTEAEWEYACRSGSKGRWCFGDDARQLGDWAWFRRNSGGRTHSVGQKRASKFGLYDMHGNVWEMCSDWYSPYASAAITDPQGPASGTKRVCRGGSWDNKSCRSAVRGCPAPDDRRNDFGFRVVVPAQK